MAVVEIVNDETGELEEIELGGDDLKYYVFQREIANRQIKAWEQRRAMCNQVIDQVQEDRVAVYDSDLGDIKVTKRGPSYTAAPNMEALLKEELTRDDLRTLLAASKGIDLSKVDPGLRGSDPATMKPTTNLGKLVKEFLARTPYKAGYIIFEAVTMLAGEKPKR